MQVFSSLTRITRLLFVSLLIAGSVALVGLPKAPYTPRDKAFWARKDLVEFVRPGLNITINSAKISNAGAISITYTLTDPNGLPLDAAGVTTPGAISLAFVAELYSEGLGTICRVHDRTGYRHGTRDHHASRF